MGSDGALFIPVSSYKVHKLYDHANKIFHEGWKAIFQLYVELLHINMLQNKGNVSRTRWWYWQQRQPLRLSCRSHQHLKSIPELCVHSYTCVSIAHTLHRIHVTYMQWRTTGRDWRNPSKTCQKQVLILLWIPISRWWTTIRNFSGS